MECRHNPFPMEIWGHVFALLLDPKALASASRVCREWNMILREEVFWKTLLTNLGRDLQKPFAKSWHEQYKIMVLKQKGSVTVTCCTYAMPLGNEASGCYREIFFFTEEGDILRMYGSVVSRTIEGYGFDTISRELFQKQIMNSDVKEIEIKQRDEPTLIQCAASYPFVALLTRSYSKKWQIKLINSLTNIFTVIPLTIDLERQQFRGVIHLDGSRLYVVPNTNDKRVQSRDIILSSDQIFLDDWNEYNPDLSAPIAGMQSNSTYLLILSDRISLMDRKTKQICHLTNPSEFPLVFESKTPSNYISLCHDKCAALSSSGELRVWHLKEEKVKPFFVLQLQIPQGCFVKIIVHWDVLIVGYCTSANYGILEIWDCKTGERILERRIEHSISTLDADEGRILVSDAQGKMTIFDFSPNPSRWPLNL